MRVLVVTLFLTALFALDVYAQKSSPDVYAQQNAHVFQELEAIDQNSEIFPPILNAVISAINDPEKFIGALNWLGAKNLEEGVDGRYKMMFGGASYVFYNEKSKAPNADAKELDMIFGNTLIQFFTGYLMLLDNRSYCEDQTAGGRIQAIANLLSASKLLEEIQALPLEARLMIYNRVVEYADQAKVVQLNWVCHDGVAEMKRYDIEEDYICTEKMVNNAKHKDCQVKDSVQPLYVTEDVWAKRKVSNREHMKQMLVGE